LTSATTTLGIARVGQQTALEVTVVFYAPLQAEQTLWLDVTPLGPEGLLTFMLTSSAFFGRRFFLNTFIEEIRISNRISVSDSES
jgi:hypothetical protein